MFKSEMLFSIEQPLGTVFGKTHNISLSMCY